MNQSRDMEQARKRAETVFAVRSGRITAKEAARQLGVSRKTYYDWENRALLAMTKAMEEGTAGRPSISPDKEKQHLQEQISELQKKLFVAEKTVEVRDMLHAYELQNAGGNKAVGAALEKKRK